MRVMGAADRSAVAAEAVGQESGNTTDGSNTDPRQVVDLPVGQTLFQIGNNLPTIDERLQFRGCAEVLEEIAALVDVCQADDRLKERVFGARLLTVGIVSVRFHNRISVLTR